MYGSFFKAANISSLSSLMVVRSVVQVSIYLFMWVGFLYTDVWSDVPFLSSSTFRNASLLSFNLHGEFNSVVKSINVM